MDEKESDVRTGGRQTFIIYVQPKTVPDTPAVIRTRRVQSQASLESSRQGRPPHALARPRLGPGLPSCHSNATCTTPRIRCEGPPQGSRRGGALAALVHTVGNKMSGISTCSGGALGSALGSALDSALGSALGSAPREPMRRQDGRFG